MSPTPPRLRTLSPEVTRAALASGDALTLFVARDGLTHRLDLDTGAARDRRLAPAVIVGEPRDGAARAETDQGPAWLDLGGRLLPAPADLALLGPPSELGWDLDLADASLPYALATVDEGTATLRLTTDGASWQGPLEAGPRGAVLAATVSRDGGERVVTTLEARLSGAALVQRALRTAPALALDAPVTLEDDVPAFGARVATCASGPARYFAVATSERVTVYRVRGRRLDAAQAEMPFPSGYELGLTCEGERALVGLRPTPPRGRHLLFAFDDAPRAVPLEVPLDARGATLHAVTLLGDGAVAFVSTAGALRAYRYTPSEGRALGRWRPAGIVALTVTPEGHTRSFTRVAARASGEHVALFVDGLVTPQAERPAPGAEAPPAPPPVRYTTVVHSRDGAGSFWSL